MYWMISEKKSSLQNTMCNIASKCVCICGYKVCWIVKALHIHYNAWIPQATALACLIPQRTAYISISMPGTK